MFNKTKNYLKKKVMIFTNVKLKKIFKNSKNIMPEEKRYVHSVVKD